MPHNAINTGLITLDPRDPTFVVISTDVNPATKEPLGPTHQIFKSTIELDDSIATIKREQLSDDNKRQNLRPIVVSTESHKVITWLRGQYYTYKDYYMDAVGIVLR